MKLLILPACLVALLTLSQPGIAGDRDGVSQVLRDLEGNWKDAEFSVDLTGLSNNDALVDLPLQIEYEAAQRGYVSYLRVSSHGDMSLFRGASVGASDSGNDRYLIKPPLGTEQVIVLFSDQPLDQLFAGASGAVDLGSDREHAQALVRSLGELSAHGTRIATRRYQYNVSVPAGGTEYTTRGIEFQVERARRQSERGGGEARIPSHIQFEFNSDRLTEQGKRDLDVFGEAMVSGIRDGSVLLEGHTDDVGADDYNMTLSWQRAESVRKYLEDSFGIRKERLLIDGKGKAEPIKPNDTEANRSWNRRVDIVFKSTAPSAPSANR